MPTPPITVAIYAIESGGTALWPAEARSLSKSMELPGLTQWIDAQLAR